MRPTFRPDLICSREEQQGVVFYRVDDPKSETNFRLYEIEYLIAQKLDGSRTLDEVIASVRADYSFDISETDLARFVSQLDAMGFLSKPDSIEPELEASGANAGVEILVDEGTAPMAFSVPIEIDHQPGVDQAEMERLLRSALLHVKQGYIVHARDYFLAARELDPSDERLSRLVSHLEIIGDASGPAEVEYLWDQARKLFPQIISELGQVIDAKSGGPGSEPPESQLKGKRNTARLAGEESLKTRVLWSLLLLVVLVGGGGLLWWLAREGGVFESPTIVQTAQLESTSVPLYYPESPTSVRPLKERNLSFSERGRIAEWKVKAGAHVTAGDLLASLELPPPQQKQIAVAKAAVEKMQSAYEKVKARLDAVVAERQAIERERDICTEKLKELQPRVLLKQGGVSKRDLEKWRQAKMAAQKKLVLAEKKEKGPANMEAAAKKRLEAAQQHASMLERKIAGRLLRAPFTGTLVSIKAKQGDPVGDRMAVALLRDDSEAVLAFDIAREVKLAAGGSVQVSVDRGAPGRARVVEVKVKGGKTHVEVALPDPSGTFAQMEPGKFRLVSEIIDPAYRVPMSSIAETNNKAHVYVITQDRALARDVEVIESDAASAVVRDVSGSLHNGDKLLVASTETGDVTKIADGAFVKSTEDVAKKR